MNKKIILWILILFMLSSFVYSIPCPGHVGVGRYSDSFYIYNWNQTDGWSGSGCTIYNTTDEAGFPALNCLAKGGGYPNIRNVGGLSTNLSVFENQTLYADIYINESDSTLAFFSIMITNNIGIADLYTFNNSVGYSGLSAGWNYNVTFDTSDPWTVQKQYDWNNLTHSSFLRARGNPVTLNFTFANVRFVCENPSSNPAPQLSNIVCGVNSTVAQWGNESGHCYWESDITAQVNWTTPLSIITYSSDTSGNATQTGLTPNTAYTNMNFTACTTSGTPTNCTSYVNYNFTTLANENTVPCNSVSALTSPYNTTDSIYVNWTMDACDVFNNYVIHIDGSVLDTSHDDINVKFYNFTSLTNNTEYLIGIQTNSTGGYLSDIINVTAQTAFQETAGTRIDWEFYPHIMWVNETYEVIGVKTFTDTNCTLEWGATAAYGKINYSITPKRVHKLYAHSGSAGTLNHYKITCTDDSGNWMVSNSTFKYYNDTQEDYSIVNFGDYQYSGDKFSPVHKDTAESVNTMFSGTTDFGLMIGDLIAIGERYYDRNVSSYMHNMTQLLGNYTSSHPIFWTCGNHDGCFHKTVMPYWVEWSLQNEFYKVKELTWDNSSSVNYQNYNNYTGIYFTLNGAENDTDSYMFILMNSAPLNTTGGYSEDNPVNGSQLEHTANIVENFTYNFMYVAEHYDIFRNATTRNTTNYLGIYNMIDLGKIDFFNNQHVHDPYHHNLGANVTLYNAGASALLQDYYGLSGWTGTKGTEAMDWHLGWNQTGDTADALYFWTNQSFAIMNISLANSSVDFFYKNVTDDAFLHIQTVYSKQYEGSVSYPLPDNLLYTNTTITNESILGVLSGNNYKNITWTLNLSDNSATYCNGTNITTGNLNIFCGGLDNVTDHILHARFNNGNTTFTNTSTLNITLTTSATVLVFESSLSWLNASISNDTIIGNFTGAWDNITWTINASDNSATYCNGINTTEPLVVYCGGLSGSTTYNLWGKAVNNTNFSINTVTLTTNATIFGVSDVSSLSCFDINLIQANCSYTNQSYYTGFRVWVNSVNTHNVTTLSAIINTTPSSNTTVGISAFTTIDESGIVYSSVLTNSSVNDMRVDIVLNKNFFITDFRDLPLGLQYTLNKNRYYSNANPKNFTVTNTTNWDSNYVNTLRKVSNGTSEYVGFKFNVSIDENSTFEYQTQLSDLDNDIRIFIATTGGETGNGFGIRTAYDGHTSNVSNNLSIFSGGSTHPIYQTSTYDSFTYVTLKHNARKGKINSSISLDNGDTWTLLHNNATNVIGGANWYTSIVFKNTGSGNITRYSYYGKSGTDGIIDVQLNNITSVYMPYSNQTNVTHILKKKDKTEVTRQTVTTYKSNVNNYMATFTKDDFTDNGEYYITVAIGDGATVEYIDTPLFNISNFGNGSFLMDDCSSYPYPALRMCIYNEETPAMALNGDIDIEFTYWDLTNMTTIHNFTATWDNVSCEDICISKAGVYANADAYIKYTANGGFTHRYYLQNESLSTTLTTLSMYNFNTTTGVNDLKITLRQQINFEYFPLVVGKLQRHYVDEGVWRTVQMDKSGDQGLNFFNIKEENTDYRFIFVDEYNHVLRTTDSMKFVCTSGVCDVTFLLANYTIGTAPNNLSVLTYYLNSTGLIYINFSDSLGTTTSLRALVTKQNLAGNTLLCNTTVTAAAGSITCNVSSQTGEVLVELFKTQSPESPFSAEWLYIKARTLALLIGRLDGGIWTFAITATIIMVGIFSPVASIITAILALIVSQLIGLMSPLTIAGTILAIIIGIVIGIKVKQ